MCIQLLHSYLKHTKGQVRASTEKKKRKFFWDHLTLGSSKYGNKCCLSSCQPGNDMNLGCLRSY